MTDRSERQGRVIPVQFAPNTWTDGDPGRSTCARCGAPTTSVKLYSLAVWTRDELCPGCRQSHDEAAAWEAIEANARTASLDRLARCAIPPRHQDLRLRDQLTQREGESLAQLHTRCGSGSIGVTRSNAAVIEALEAYRPSNHSLYLFGPGGTGKTQLAAALVTEHAIGGVEAWFITEARLLDCERRRIADRNLPAAVERAGEVPLLVLDDFGAGEAASEWAIDQIEAVVCRRYDATLPIVITSNLRLDAARGRYGERVYSRLREMVGEKGFLEVSGPDWRTAR